MTKRSFLFAFTFFIAVTCIGQAQNYFEGTITYKFDFKSNVPNVNAALLERILGSGSTLFFKEGNYYHKYDGGMYEFDLYSRADNKMYMKKRNNDTIFWIECGEAGDRVQDFKFTAKKETVLGIVCDQLIIQYEKKSEIHYYNSDSILTNPKWFKNFKLNDENLIDEKEKSIFLKSESEYKDFTMIETATKLTRKKIDDKLFKLPANAILAKEE